jgi:hypothetical protein
VWHKTAEQILERLAGSCAATNERHDMTIRVSQGFRIVGRQRDGIRSLAASVSLSRSSGVFTGSGGSGT